MNSDWSHGPETAKWDHDLCNLDLSPLTLAFCMDITSVIGNHFWKFHDDTMRGTLWKRCHRQTDRQADRQTEITIPRAAWSQLKTHERCGPSVCFPITNSYPQCHGIFTMAEVTIGFHSMRQCVIIMGVGACCVWLVFMALGSSIL